MRITYDDHAVRFLPSAKANRLAHDSRGMVNTCSGERAERLVSIDVQSCFDCQGAQSCLTSSLKDAHLQTVPRGEREVEWDQYSTPYGF